MGSAAAPCRYAVAARSGNPAAMHCPFAETDAACGLMLELSMHTADSRDAPENALRRLENCLRCARAELASDPANALLREFIELNEALVRKERAKGFAAHAT